MRKRLKQQARGNVCKAGSASGATYKRGQPGLGSRMAARFAGIGLRKGEEIEELRGYPALPADFGSEE